MPSTRSSTLKIAISGGLSSSTPRRNSAISGLRWQISHGNSSVRDQNRVCPPGSQAPYCDASSSALERGDTARFEQVEQAHEDRGRRHRVAERGMAAGDVDAETVGQRIEAVVLEVRDTGKRRSAGCRAATLSNRMPHSLSFSFRNLRSNAALCATSADVADEGAELRQHDFDRRRVAQPSRR